MRFRSIRVVGARTVVPIAAFLLATGSLTACGGSDDDESSGSGTSTSSGAAKTGGDPIVIADLEGPAATGDPDFTKGMKIAEAEINAAGGVNGRKVQVKVFKKGLTPDSAISTYRQAGADKKTLAAWGAATGVVAMAAQSDRVQLPLFGVPGRIDFVKPARKWVYSISADQAYPAAAVKFAIEQKQAKRIAVLHYTETDYSSGVTQAIKDRCTKDTEFGPALGCEVVAEETGKLTDTPDQLIPLLTKMKNSGADAYYIETLNPNGPKAARQLGMFDKPVISEQWLSVPAIAEACGKACEDIVFSAQKCVAPDIAEASDPAKEFCTGYSEKFAKTFPNEPYALFSVYGYDAVKIVAAAAKKVLDGGKEPNPGEPQRRVAKPRRSDPDEPWRAAQPDGQSPSHGQVQRGLLHVRDQHQER